MFNGENDVYKILFDQTPIIIRWALGVLSLGIFSLAGILWKRQQDRISRLEKESATKVEIEDMKGQVDRIDKNTMDLYNYFIGNRGDKV